MYVFHTNQIWDFIKDQSNCSLYIWIVFMNICFGFKVRSSLFCYRFDLIGSCWSQVSIPILDFYVAFGENICVWVLKLKSVWKFHSGEGDSFGLQNQLVQLMREYMYNIC